MITFRYKVTGSVNIDKLFEAYKKNGFYISNPDCKSGKSLDIIIRDNQRIVGFDLLLDDTEPYLLMKGQ